jgi:hypothetical protein
MMNWKESGMKETLPNQGAIPGMCLEGLRKPTKDLRAADVAADVQSSTSEVYKSRMLPLDKPVRYKMSFWLCDVDYKHGDCANP